jgi:hypothetical protein
VEETAKPPPSKTASKGLLERDRRLLMIYAHAGGAFSSSPTRAQRRDHCLGMGRWPERSNTFARWRQLHRMRD